MSDPPYVRGEIKKKGNNLTIIREEYWILVQVKLEEKYSLNQKSDFPPDVCEAEDFIPQQRWS